MADARTYNERILDAEIQHQVGILRFRSGAVDRVLEGLEDIEADLAKQLRVRLGKINERGFDIGPGTTRRLRFLRASVREILNGAYKEIGNKARAELFSIAQYEADFQVRLLQANTPFTDLTLAFPPATALRSIVTSTPLEGKLLAEMLRESNQNAIRRVNQAIRIGIAEGETMPQIVSRVRGANVLGLSKRGISTVVRTAVTGVTTQAREAVFNANTDIISAVRWVSTLDSRTTDICKRRDGKFFPVGKGPRPPAHLNCRSVTAPILDQNDPIFGDRASQVGPVPAGQTYGQWLKNQPASFQDDVLGPTRGKLFRKGGITMDRFIDFSGRRYTLAELQSREVAAFRKAGVKL